MDAIAARIAFTFLMLLWAVGLCGQAFAYRPFDGTDAAVADFGTIEIEVEPAGHLHEKSERTLIAPAVRLNYGLTEKWEAVLEGQWAHGLSADTKRSSLVSNGAFLKGVIREGSLQGRSGPSFATELGVLLPGINDEPGVGGSIAGIASQRWPWLTVHLNAAAAITRQRHGDLFFSIIAEGPHDWNVRPVAELSCEREFRGLRATSGLVGAIWQVRDNVAIDVGLRAARINDHPLNEVRAGVTFSFAVR